MTEMNGSDIILSPVGFNKSSEAEIKESSRNHIKSKADFHALFVAYRRKLRR